MADPLCDDPLCDPRDGLDLDLGIKRGLNDPATGLTLLAVTPCVSKKAR